MTADSASLILHGSCVALNGNGLLILGSSGAGKSTLALALMAMGAQLVADDRVVVARDGDALIACAPAALSGMVEARGIGLLGATPLPQARLHLVVDLDQTEPDRLPPRREISLLACRLPLVLGKSLPHLSIGLAQYLRGGRRD
ncbi:HPr kinase/phosphorylase [Gemmobacter serpentinus]|uniref:HPr kinase/phosphorylase n=1 Tax=Gemmobacter serpentinus TaxID=2652247 RepID=UPI00299F4B73|nr:HPr kinase/phosphatase C-terminal domain-containing protein [Gemmobacter serpentinus]